MAPNIFVNAMYESYSWDSGFLDCFILSSSRRDTELMLCNKGLLNLICCVKGWIWILEQTSIASKK